MKSYRLFGKLFLVSLSVCSLSSAGCKKDKDNNPVERNITETIVNDPQLTLLEAAVVKAGLSQTLAESKFLVSSSCRTAGR